MKKNFLFAVAVFAALAVNVSAKTYLWNDFGELGDITANRELQGITLLATDATNEDGAYTQHFVLETKSAAWTNPDNSKDNVTFSQRLKTVGKSASAGRQIMIPVVAGAKIEIWALAGGSTGDRTVALSESPWDGAAAGIFTSAKLTNTGTPQYSSFTYTGAQSYLYVYAPVNGINIFGIRISADNLVIADGPEQEGPAPWDFGNWELSTGYTNGVYNNLGLYACSPSAETQITNFGATNAHSKTFTDGFISVNRFQLNGAGAPEEGTCMPKQRFVYFDVTAASEIKVWFMTGGSGDRTLFITDGENVLGQLTHNGSSDPLILSASSTGAGRIYIYADKACNLYKITATNVGTTTPIQETQTGLEEVFSATKATKIVKDGQVVIIKADGRKFNLLGAEIK